MMIALHTTSTIGFLSSKSWKKTETERPVHGFQFPREKLSARDFPKLYAAAVLNSHLSNFQVSKIAFKNLRVNNINTFFSNTTIVQCKMLRISNLVIIFISVFLFAENKTKLGNL